MKSGERVTNHGEVFTAEHEVNARLDLVTGNKRIASRFLDIKPPALANFEVDRKKRLQVAHL